MTLGTEHNRYGRHYAERNDAGHGAGCGRAGNAHADFCTTICTLKIILILVDQIYDILAPRRLKLSVENTNPLPLAPVKAWHGLDATAGGSLFILLTTVIILVSTLVSPSVAMREEARDVLCGEALAFCVLI